MVLSLPGARNRGPDGRNAVAARRAVADGPERCDHPSSGSWQTAWVHRDPRPNMRPIRHLYIPPIHKQELHKRALSPPRKRNTTLHSAIR